MMSPELEDSIASVMAWIVLVVVPVIGISLFLLVHVLPEKIAAKRHHPQKEAIHILCLLSLFFGGLLWPIAWLWAYTRPVTYKLAYGTDKHPAYFTEMVGKAERGELDADEIASLTHEFERISEAGLLTPDLARARASFLKTAGAGAGAGVGAGVGPQALAQGSAA